MSSSTPFSRSLSRRGFVAGTAGAAGAIALSPLLSACGNSAATSGANSKSGLAAALPNHYPLADAPAAAYPSKAGSSGAATDPGYTAYPANLVKTVNGKPGSGGTYSATVQTWDPIPAAGNQYYKAVNEALGATFNLEPASATTYATTIPPLIAAGKLPDWLAVPGWMASSFNVSELVNTRFADLTPYLSGDKIRDYPNLAAIPTGGWASGVWNNKLYGIPSYTSGMPLAGALFYRADKLSALGITPEVKTADNLYSLGKEVNNPKGAVYAFENLFVYLQQVYGVPAGGFYVDSAGKLASSFEHPAYTECLAWCHKAAVNGLVHPDALNGISASPSRFQSGRVLIEGNGLGAWGGGDSSNGQAADPAYQRQAFPLFSADGSTPTVGLGSASSWMSYLNKDLSPAQIKECLRIANYFAAPYGSYEYTLIAYGVEGVDWTWVDGAPKYTTQGKNTAADQVYGFCAAPQNMNSNPGFNAVTKAIAEWCYDTVEHCYKSVFVNMNIDLPSKFSATSAAAQLTDQYTEITSGKAPVSSWADALKTWKGSGGGDKMIAWYQTNVVDKYGTGV